MKKLYLLLLLISASLISKAQVPVLMQSFEGVHEYNTRYTFAEDNFYLDHDTIFIGYNLKNHQLIYPPKTWHGINGSISSVKEKALYSAHKSFQSIYVSDSVSTLNLIEDIDTLGIFSGTHYSLISATNSFFSTDGSKEGTIEIFSDDEIFYYSTNAFYVDNRDKFFIATGGYMRHHPYSLLNRVYETDGTIAGTRLLNTTSVDTIAKQFFVHPPDDSLYLIQPDYNKTNIYRISSVDGNLELIGSYSFILGSENRIKIVNNKILSFATNYDNELSKLIVVEGDSYRDLATAGYRAQFVGYFKNSALFTSFNEEDSLCLYSTDGTTEGTKLVANNLGKRVPFEFKNTLYYEGTDDQHGSELWQYDGSKVSLVADVEAGIDGLSNFTFHVFNNELFFAARSTKELSRLSIYRLSDNASNISISTFADYNKNGEKDIDEPDVPYQHYLFTPDSIHFYPTQAQANISLENGDYELSLLPQKGWDLSQGHGTLSLSLPADANKHYTFAVFPDSTYTSIETKFVGGISRCSSSSTFTIHYKNTGIANVSGEISFYPDKKFTLKGTEPFAEGNIDSGLSWPIGSLSPHETGTLTISVQNPSFESMGDTLVSTVVSDFLSSAHSYRDTLTLSQIVTCAYDPNDIQVNPAGQGEKHLTLKKQTLDYLIRFQNTGNDTAYQVVVKDTLGTDFDLESLSIVGSSHSMITTLKDNVLKFNFEKIMLPDSTRDEPNSHGYILYTIAPKSSLADSTVLYNKADIFFDYNPPVTTNTVFNTLVDKLPDNSGKVLGVKSTSRIPFTIYPNPASEEIKIKWEGKANVFSYQIYSSTGQNVLTTSSSNKGRDKIDISMLTNGVYYLKVTSKDGVDTFRIAVVKE